MSMTEWAKKEVEILEKSCSKDDDYTYEYVSGCAHSALRAYELMAKDDYSGMSHSCTRSIMDRLMLGLPLSEIKDVDESWDFVAKTTDHNGKVYDQYQCLRDYSVFKYIHENGKVTYNDVSRIVCLDIKNKVQYYNAKVSELVNELIPITFPYYPSTDPIKVLCRDFLYDPEQGGDFDTLGIFYAVFNNYGDRLLINKYFKGEDRGWIEISKEEYHEREVKSNEKLH